MTGILTPWSFHTAVIPRLRAINPVRIEFGVHFCGPEGSDGVVSVVVAEEEAWEGVFAETEACSCLTAANCRRLQTVRSPSISVGCWFIEK